MAGVVTPNQERVMHALRGAGWMASTEIARRTGLSRERVNQTLRGLFAKRLVERRGGVRAMEPEEAPNVHRLAAEWRETAGQICAADIGDGERCGMRELNTLYHAPGPSPHHEFVPGMECPACKGRGYRPMPLPDGVSALCGICRGHGIVPVEGE